MKYLVSFLGLIIVIGGILLFTLPTPHQNIEVTSLKNGNSVSSPLTIEGYAKGTWFFEGDAPIILVDENDNIIGQSYITSKEDWMTEKFIPFTGIIEFSKREGQGTLILKKDNPSGLPKFDDSLEIKINFK